MSYSSAKLTTKGQELLTRVIAGDTKIMFTRIATSEYSINEFAIKQELIPSVSREEDRIISVGAFTNTNITEAYYINTVGVYAKDSEDIEVLFSYIEADDNPRLMEAYTGSHPQTITFKIDTGISLDSSISIDISPEGQVTQLDLEKKYTINKVDSALPKASKDLAVGDGIWYITSENKRARCVKEKDEYFDYQDITLAEYEESPSQKDLYATNDGKYYHSIFTDERTQEIEYREEETLPPTGTYANGTYVISDSKLYMAMASKASGYEELSLEIVDTIGSENNKYYLVGKTLYYTHFYKWVEISVESVAELPAATEDTVDKYYITADKTLHKGLKHDTTYKWLVIDGNTKIVTIPIYDASTWTYDGTNKFYSIDVNVDGMTETYEGTKASDYVRAYKNGVLDTTTNETYVEAFNMIIDMVSHNGYITVYANDKLATAIQIYLYGV